MLDLTINLPGAAISANALYKRGRDGQVFLAPEATKYRKDAVKPVKVAARKSGKYEGGLLHADIYVWGKFFNNDGSIKDVDLDNSLKNLLDSIFPNLGIKDSTIFTINLHKIHTKLNPKCQVRIWETQKPNLTSR